MTRKIYVIKIHFDRAVGISRCQSGGVFLFFPPGGAKFGGK